MALWQRRKLNIDGRSVYAVLVHARGLRISDDQRVECVGGAYIWRFVKAPTREIAAEEPIKSLLTTPVLSRRSEILLADVAVDEVVAVDRRDDSRGTGVVFYIETDE